MGHTRRPAEAPTGSIPGLFARTYPRRWRRGSIHLREVCTQRLACHQCEPQGCRALFIAKERPWRGRQRAFIADDAGCNGRSRTVSRGGECQCGGRCDGKLASSRTRLGLVRGKASTHLGGSLYSLSEPFPLVADLPSVFSAKFPVTAAISTKIAFSAGLSVRGRSAECQVRKFAPMNSHGSPVPTCVQPAATLPTVIT